MHAAPSPRFIECFVLANTNRIMELSNKMTASITDSERTVSGEITDDIPRMNIILNRLEPTALPSANPLSPLPVATIDVTSSGRDVPIAMIVRPIKF